MALRVDHRVSHLRMRRVVFRQGDRRAEIDRLAPPLAQNLALNLDALYRVRVRRHLHRRNDLVGHQANRRGRIVGGGIEMQLHGSAVEVAWRPPPVLTLPLIHVQPHGVAIGALELRVDVDERLHPIIARGNLAQARDGVAEIVGADRRRRVRREHVDVLAEERRARRIGLLDRRPIVHTADRNVDASCHRRAAGRGREADLDARPAVDTGDALIGNDGRVGQDSGEGRRRGDSKEARCVHTPRILDPRVSIANVPARSTTRADPGPNVPGPTRLARAARAPTGRAPTHTRGHSNDDSHRPTRSRAQVGRREPRTRVLADATKHTHAQWSVRTPRRAQSSRPTAMRRPCAGANLSSVSTYDLHSPSVQYRFPLTRMRAIATTQAGSSNYEVTTYPIRV